MTTGSPDVSDRYEIDVDAKDPGRYLYDGEWKTMTTREVTVAVLDGVAVTRTLEYTTPQRSPFSRSGEEGLEGIRRQYAVHGSSAAERCERGNRGRGAFLIKYS
jgi:hypothetical protein